MITQKVNNASRLISDKHEILRFMSHVTMARTRWQYDSYKDFWTLVELSGLDTCYIDEIDLSRETVYVTTPMNGETRPAIESARTRVVSADRKARLVWWALERPDQDNAKPFKEEVDAALKFFDEVWVSDAHFASLDTRVRHVVLGSHPKLREGHVARPLYDFAHMSYVWGRRAEVIHELEKKYEVAPNAWGAKRAQILNATKVMFNTHQTPSPIGEPLRFAIAAAFRLPLLTESLAAPFPLERGRHFIDVPLDHMIDEAKGFLRRTDLDKMGNELHDELCIHRTFANGVNEAAVDLLSKSAT